MLTDPDLEVHYSPAEWISEDIWIVMGYREKGLAELISTGKNLGNCDQNYLGREVVEVGHEQIEDDLEFIIEKLSENEPSDVEEKFSEQGVYIRAEFEGKKVEAVNQGGSTLTNISPDKYPIVQAGKNVVLNYFSKSEVKYHGGKE